MKVWDGKKWLYGAAAQQHIIRKNGGWDAHHEKFGSELLSEFVKTFVGKFNNEQVKFPLRRVR